MTGPTVAEVRARLGPRLLTPEAAFNAADFSVGTGAGERMLAVAEYGAAYRPAAVLVPLVAHRRGVTVLLTERAADLAEHGGQISFPGGSLEEGDRDAVDAALREAEEEVGLAAADVRVLGALEPRGTVSNFRVTPVVGLVRPFRPILQAAEVATAFEVPFAFVLDSANHAFLERGADGRSAATYAIPFGERFIFGFTARILIRIAQLWHGRGPSGPPAPGGRR